MKKSVALCTYNGEKYIRPQLESILQQSIAVQEIVICDDQSSDKTHQILLEYQNQYPDLFKIHLNEENLGYVKNFEKTIMLCSGELIFLSDQDDIWYKEKVKCVEETFQNNPEIEVLCHNINILENHNYEHDYWNTRKFSANINNQEILEMTVIKGNIFPGMSMVITKDAVLKYFPLKKMNHIIIHDVELVIQSCKNNTFFALQKILGHYRLHENQNIGFDSKKLNKLITAEDLYHRKINIAYIREIISLFQLDSQLLTQYNNAYHQTIEDYLNQFPFWKRLYLKIKLTYYHKIN